MPETRTEYAKVVWVVEDILDLRPDLTPEEADDFLSRNARNIQDRMCERGYEAIETLLELDDEIPPAPQNENTA